MHILSENHGIIFLVDFNREFLKRPNDLNIPQFEPDYDYTPSPVLSPEGRVAARLEKISQEIMERVPHLLDKPLKIIQAGNLSYEKFCVAARHLTFDHQIVGWSKVALLCHFAREVAMMGELDDTQLELLADYSFRFIQESTAEWIEKKGGWVGASLYSFYIANGGCHHLKGKYHEVFDLFCSKRWNKTFALLQNNSRTTRVEKSTQFLTETTRTLF